jgi:hypothetical protein
VSSHFPISLHIFVIDDYHSVVQSDCNMPPKESKESNLMRGDAAFRSYEAKCVCGHSEDNNCAHYLTNALISGGGFHQLDGGKGANQRIVNEFLVCASGRPLRAKEVRDLFFKKIGLTLCCVFLIIAAS